VILTPKLNEKDLVDVPAEIKAKLNLILVETVDEGPRLSLRDTLFVEIFHWVSVAGAKPECFTLHPSLHSLPQRPLILAFCASQSSVLSLRSLAFILSSVPCFVKRARSASADSLLCPATCSSSCVTSSSVTSMFSAVAMWSTISSAFTSSFARSSLPLPQRYPVHVYRPRVHTLRR